jgi:hypothetical protein
MVREIFVYAKITKTFFCIFLRNFIILAFMFMFTFSVIFV